MLPNDSSDPGLKFETDVFRFQIQNFHPRPDLASPDFDRKRVGKVCRRLLLEGGQPRRRVQPQVSGLGPG